MLKPEELLTKDQIAAFDQSHGEDQVAVIRGRNKRDPTKYDWEIAFRMPLPAEYQLFKSRSQKEATQSRAQELLIKQVLIHPTREKLDEFIGRWPGLCESNGITRALQEMLGLVSDEVEKI